MLLSMEVVKKTISTLNFSKPSRTTWVQILRIVRKHKDETVNIFRTTPIDSFLVVIKRKNTTFLAFAKILSKGFFSLSPKTIIPQ